MIEDVFVIEDNKIIINMGGFYDCLKLVKNVSESFKDESKVLLKNGIKQCKEFLNHNKKVVLRNLNVVEWEFNSIDEFQEWLTNDANKELGIELVYAVCIGKCL